MKMIKLLLIKLLKRKIETDIKDRDKYKYSTYINII